MCAYLPTAPQKATTDMQTQDLIILRWEPPPTDGGTPILGYKLYMKRSIDPAFDLSKPIYDGYQDPVVRMQYITSYAGNPLQAITYNFMTRSRNWVGWSPDSLVLDVTLPLMVKPSSSVVGGDGVTLIDASVDATVTVLSIDQTGNPKNNPPLDIYFLHVMDRCA